MLECGSNFWICCQKLLSATCFVTCRRFGVLLAWEAPTNFWGWSSPLRNRQSKQSICKLGGCGGINHFSLPSRTKPTPEKVLFRLQISVCERRGEKHTCAKIGCNLSQKTNEPSKTGLQCSGHCVALQMPVWVWWAEG